MGGAIGLFSAIARGESASNVIVATVAGAATGALCAMGAWGILAGSTLSGVATGLTAKGTTKEKVVRGAVAFGSTLFWGGYGYGLAKEAGNGAVENFVFDTLFGTTAEIVSQASQAEAVKALNKSSVKRTPVHSASSVKMVLMER